MMRASVFLRGMVVFILALIGFRAETSYAADVPRRVIRPEPVDGFRGIWYMNQPQPDEYAFKYSGGLATYPQQHEPIAVYADAVRKTFFVYGGMSLDGHEKGVKRSVEIMVSYFDHATGRIAKPRRLSDRKTDDAHDNPTIMLDDAGHVWVISPSHGVARPAYIYRSLKPYDIEAFEEVYDRNFSYPQPWWLPGEGFLFLHTHYVKGNRFLHSMQSKDGLNWTEPRLLAGVEKGHYQISWRNGKRLGTAFNLHPAPIGLNARTNLYYMEIDGVDGEWKTAGGEKVPLPISEVKNVALVRDYRSEKKLVYLKDLNFDAKGRPVIVYLTSNGYMSGPASEPHEWMLAHWMGNEWQFLPITRSDHNYDTGCLHIERDGTWRLIAPTDPGPQPFNPGGEVVMWTSRDEGKTWSHRPLTTHSPLNHTYMRRPVDADPAFYALWADGNTRKPSEVHLYYCDQAGHVFRLPREMTSETEVPVAVPMTPGTRTGG